MHDSDDLAIDRAGSLAELAKGCATNDLHVRHDGQEPIGRLFACEYAAVRP